MLRRVFVCALILTWAGASRADDNAAPNETVIRFTVGPSKAPIPALRYQLLPEIREITPGNAVLGYMLCFAEQNTFWFSKEARDNREKWQTAPLADLKTPEVRKFGYGPGSGPLHRADVAARMDKADWQVLLRLKAEGANLLLPEIQQLRMLGSALKVRFRVEVAEGRFQDALTTAKTIFSLAQHLAEHPTIICGVVGIAVANLGVGPLEEMVQQPGCPSLFWALSDLPKPLINVRNGLQGERIIFSNILDLLEESAPVSESQLTKAVDQLQSLFNGFDDVRWKKQGFRDWLRTRVKDELEVGAARKRLAAAGLVENKVKQFPALQVILLDGKISYEVKRDEFLSAAALPFWQGETVVGAGERSEGEKNGSPLLGLASSFRNRIRFSQARLESQIGLLTCLEALRLYAGDHGGQLPGQLADIKLPLPVDPVTGKNFLYKREGETAILQNTPPKEMEKNAAYNFRFVVAIAK
jgi:hypothetical protein